jgi:hypothetical protein
MDIPWVVQGGAIARKTKVKHRKIKRLVRNFFVRWIASDIFTKG